MAPIRIALDAMGSDNHPAPEVEGAALAAREFGLEIILTGPEDQLTPLLAAQDHGGKVRIEHAPTVVSSEEKPAFASRKKADNSMARGLQLVRDGAADIFVTMGSTGAALTNALFILQRIPGVRRPALIARFPTRQGWVHMLDIGANADCRPEFLLQFGVMGSAYARAVGGIANPKVGLLSNGEEKGKGNELVRDSYPLLEASALNFVGNIEPKELFAGEADVVVTDGYTGNIFLKTSESTVRFVTDTLRTGFKSNAIAGVGALLSRPVFNDLRAKLDPAEIGAALLVGLNGLAMVGHGRSEAYAVRSAMRQAKQIVEAGLLTALRADITAQLDRTPVTAEVKE